MAFSVRSQNGVSFPVIAASAVICAIVFVTGALVVRHMVVRWSPSVRNAQRLLRDGKIDEALALASKVNAQGTAGAEIDIVAGKAWLAKAYQRQESEGWKNYGVDEEDYFESPEVRKSVEFFQRARKKDRHSIEARYYLGVVFMEKGWLGKAESAFIEALRIEPDHVLTRISLAALYVMKRQYEEAENELLRAHSVDQDNADIAKNLSFLYRYYLDEPEKAMQWSNRYLNQDPPKDPDRMFIHHDFAQMVRRYPEYAPAEDKQKWRKNQPQFEPR